MVKRVFLTALVGAGLLATVSRGEVPLGKNSQLHFASTTEARKILTTRDDFIQRISQFDRSARMKVDRSVTTEEFLAFVGNNVLDWTEQEEQNLQEIVGLFQPSLRELTLSFPPTVQLIKTTGDEEGNAAYTRGIAIILPKSILTKDKTTLQKILCHELFHVWSRQNPALREKLYETIGFHHCQEVELPSQLKERKITNPDAPKNDHFIRLKIEKQECLAVPILLATGPYDVEKGGEFFDYLLFEFLIVRRSSDTNIVTVAEENGAFRLMKPQTASGFYEQVGRNTNYILHPEEILADNFALLVLGADKEKVPSPEVLRKVQGILTNGKSK